jgi:hypothetical protein
MPPWSSVKILRAEAIEAAAPQQRKAPSAELREERRKVVSYNFHAPSGKLFLFHDFAPPMCKALLSKSPLFVL